MRYVPTEKITKNELTYTKVRITGLETGRPKKSKRAKSVKKAKKEGSGNVVKVKAKASSTLE